VGGVSCGDGKWWWWSEGEGGKRERRGGGSGLLRCVPLPSRGKAGVWNQCAVKCSLAAGYSPTLTMHQWIKALSACYRRHLRAPTWSPSAPPVPITSMLSANTQRPSPNSCGLANLRLISHQGLTPADLWALHWYCSPVTQPLHCWGNSFQRKYWTKYSIRVVYINTWGELKEEHLSAFLDYLWPQINNTNSICSLYIKQKPHDVQWCL